MPALIAAQDLPEHVGESVELRGWVESKRSSGGLVFLEVRSRGVLFQAVVQEDVVGPEVVTLARHLTRESSVIVEGVVKADRRALRGAELSVTALRAVQIAAEWPLSGVELDASRRVAERPLYLRARRQRAILRVRATLIRAIRGWLDDEGFTLVDAPIFTPNVVEERATLFETARFQRMSYLTQSGQLYNEASAAAFGRAYSFGPTFRSEPRPTRRHLAEFWMVEPELSFCSAAELIDIAERFLRETVRTTVDAMGEELRELGRDLDVFESLRDPFERISYEDAIAEAVAAGVDVQIGDDLSIDAETAITAQRGAPVFVTDYPRAVKPFYMKAHPTRPDRVLCADLLAPEGYGEILGGGERESDFETLRANILEAGIPLEHFAWYLDLRRYGSVQHSGFGLGLERALAWICGLTSMDETIPFPRLPERSAP